jgi:hypothetical protein
VGGAKGTRSIRSPEGAARACEAHRVQDVEGACGAEAGSPPEARAEDLAEGLAWGHRNALEGGHDPFENWMRAERELVSA